MSCMNWPGSVPLGIYTDRVGYTTAPASFRSRYCGRTLGMAYMWTRICTLCNGTGLYAGIFAWHVSGVAFLRVATRF